MTTFNLKYLCAHQHLAFQTFVIDFQIFSRIKYSNFIILLYFEMQEHLQNICCFKTLTLQNTKGMAPMLVKARNPNTTHWICISHLIEKVDGQLI